ncbi:BatA domain-containing protein [Dokdonella soli]|uniref:BatA domain-containing protein n=1 Tax=Dokdonella soli TaxID=529810 RepID=A0ABP3TUL6_9GAMM
MNFALLAPLGLAALTALALPILIHLVRRIELTTTEFAALRWISERVRPRRRIRFERPWLLLVRIALLALLALLLARPILIEATRPAKPWIVVAPGVDRSAAQAAVTGVNADWHWLSAGFPALDSTPSPGDVPLASLLRELDAEQGGTALTVVVPEELAGLDGERPHLAHAIDWRVVPGRMAASETAAPTAPVQFAVRYAPEAQVSLTYLRAAVAAWNAREPDRYVLDAQPLNVPIPDDTRWLAWLAPQTPPEVSARIDRGGVALLTNHTATAGEVIWSDARGDALARIVPSGQGRVLALPGALTPTAVPILLDPDFPERLLAALQGPAVAPTRSPAESLQPRHVTAVTTAMHSLDGARSLDAWLALLIAVLFLVERIVATQPRAETSA